MAVSVLRAVLQRVLAIVAQVVHVWNVVFYYANIEVFRIELCRYLRCKRRNARSSRFTPFAAAGVSPQAVQAGY